MITLPLSARSDIAPFHVMEVFDAAERRAATGAEVVRLEVGQPATPAPRGVIDRAHEVLESDRLGYTSSQGIPELRHALAAYYDDWYELDIDPDRIVITAGASGGFTLAFLAAFDVGQRVAVTVPGYPCYRNALEAIGVEVVPLMTRLEDNFQPTIADLEALSDVDGLVLTSPSNPTGTMVDHALLGEIVAWCDRSGTTLVSDEIYHGLTYEGSASTALAHGDELIVVNSFSKYFSMTGWRLGWVVVPEHVVGPIVKFASNLLLAPASLSQHAAVAAFECHDELQQHLVRYRRNRDVLLEGLPTVGLDRLAPAQGAFYAYADVSHVCDDSQDLCRRWLSELGIAATPGTDFDPWNGHRFVRFSFCGETEDMHRAIELLGTWSP
ncbi:MAG: aminotransferase class I/II-fold pyridoxal phosphate-dependent enzyme [Actinomycetota bacterium]